MSEERKVDKNLWQAWLEILEFKEAQRAREQAERQKAEAERARNKEQGK